MKNKLVSVNLTTFNRAHLLPRCLKSIINQSYKNIEIIIVDDCSKDNSADVIKVFQKKYPHIKYFRHNQNKGNAYARNTAFEKSSGYYIAFIDDDDEWIDCDKIMKQVNIFKNDTSNKIGMVCSSVKIYNDKTNFKNKLIRKPKDIFKNILSGNGLIYSPTVMIKREIMKRGGGFDTKLPRGIDSDFFRMCIVKFNYSVYFMKEITTAVHEYGPRITDKKKKESLKKILYANLYILKKYHKYILVYPSMLIKRLKHIVFALLKIMFFKDKNKQ